MEGARPEATTHPLPSSPRGAGFTPSGFPPELPRHRPSALCNAQVPGAMPAAPRFYKEETEV